jgi:hypothetical protein
MTVSMYIVPSCNGTTAGLGYQEVGLDVFKNVLSGQWACVSPSMQ